MQVSKAIGRRIFTENGWFIGYVGDVYTAPDGKAYIVSRYGTAQTPIPTDLIKAIGDAIIVDKSIYPREPMPLAPGITTRKYVYTIEGRSLGIVYDEYNYGGVTYLRIIGPSGYTAVPIDSVVAVGDVVIVSQTNVQIIPISQASTIQPQQPSTAPMGILGVGQPIQPQATEAGLTLDRIANLYLYGFFMGLAALIAFAATLLAIYTPVTLATGYVQYIPLAYIFQTIPMIVISIALVGISAYLYLIKQSIMRREFRYVIRDSQVAMAISAAVIAYLATFFIPQATSTWLMVPSAKSIEAAIPIVLAIALCAGVILMTYLGYVNTRSYMAKFKA